MMKRKADNLILVNADHAYQGRGEELVRFPGTGILLEKETAEQLYALLSTLPKGEIVLVSGYRSMEEQTKIFEESVRENGMEFTRKYVAKPGCSEHQTGLAVDLGKKAKDIDFICPAFPYEGVCQKFRERAADYGFIERYEKEKEGITGISAEQWHFRYVGRPHGWIIREKGFALEEYLAYIRQFDDCNNPLHFRYFGNEYEIYFQKGDEKAEISEAESRNAELVLDSGMQQHITISGNNVDGFIITKEKPAGDRQRKVTESAGDKTVDEAGRRDRKRIGKR